MPDLNSTPKSTRRYEFSELWGVPLYVLMLKEYPVILSTSFYGMNQKI